MTRHGRASYQKALHPLALCLERNRAESQARSGSPNRLDLSRRWLGGRMRVAWGWLEGGFGVALRWL